MEVRIGHPDEHLAKGTPKDLINPMYSTCIGLIIETVGRMNHDEQLRAAQKAKEDLKKAGQTAEGDPETPVTETLRDDQEEQGFGKKIITRLTRISETIFKPENIK